MRSISNFTLIYIQIYFVSNSLPKYMCLYVYQTILVFWVPWEYYPWVSRKTNHRKIFKKENISTNDGMFPPVSLHACMLVGYVNKKTHGHGVLKSIVNVKSVEKYCRSPRPVYDNRFSYQIGSCQWYGMWHSYGKYHIRLSRLCGQWVGIQSVWIVNSGPLSTLRHRRPAAPSARRFALAVVACPLDGASTKLGQLLTVDIMPP